MATDSDVHVIGVSSQAAGHLSLLSELRDKLRMRRVADVESNQIRHRIPWTTTFGSTKRVDPLLYMSFWEWQMRYMNSSLTNLRPTLCPLEKDGTKKQKGMEG